jgi:hypothetical protein
LKNEADAYQRSVELDDAIAFDNKGKDSDDDIKSGALEIAIICKCEPLLVEILEPSTPVEEFPDADKLRLLPHIQVAPEYEFTEEDYAEIRRLGISEDEYYRMRNRALFAATITEGLKYNETSVTPACPHISQSGSNKASKNEDDKQQNTNEDLKNSKDGKSPSNLKKFKYYGALPNSSMLADVEHVVNQREQNKLRGCGSFTGLNDVFKMIPKPKDDKDEDSGIKIKNRKKSKLSMDGVDAIHKAYARELKDPSHRAADERKTSLAEERWKRPPKAPGSITGQSKSSYTKEMQLLLDEDDSASEEDSDDDHGDEDFEPLPEEAHISVHKRATIKYKRAAKEFSTVKSMSTVPLKKEARPLQPITYAERKNEIPTFFESDVTERDQETTRRESLMRGERSSVFKNERLSEAVMRLSEINGEEMDKSSESSVPDNIVEVEEAVPVEVAPTVATQQSVIDEFTLKFTAKTNVRSLNNSAELELLDDIDIEAPIKPQAPQVFFPQRQSSMPLVAQSNTSWKEKRSRRMSVQLPRKEPVPVRRKQVITESKSNEQDIYSNFVRDVLKKNAKLEVLEAMKPLFCYIENTEPEVYSTLILGAQIRIDG